jgi:hypothetical protein
MNEARIMHTSEAGWLLIAAAIAFSFSRDPFARLGGALLIGAGCLLADAVIPLFWVPMVLLLALAALYDAVTSRRTPSFPVALDPDPRTPPERSVD